MGVISFTLRLLCPEERRTGTQLTEGWVAPKHCLQESESETIWVQFDIQPATQNVGI